MGDHTTSAGVTAAQVLSEACVFHLTVEIPASRGVYLPCVDATDVYFPSFHQDCTHPLSQLASEIFSKVVRAMLRNGQHPQEAY